MASDIIPTFSKSALYGVIPKRSRAAQTRFAPDASQLERTRAPVGTVYRDGPNGELKVKTSHGSRSARDSDITPGMRKSQFNSGMQAEFSKMQGASSQQQGGYFERAMADYDQSYKSAQQASLAQKKRVMGLHQESLDEAGGLLDTAEGRALADTRSGYAKQWAGQRQGLISKGMGSAALTTTLGAGYQRQMNESLQRVRAASAGQRIGTMSGLRGNLAGAEERVTQMYPDQARLMAAAQAMGQGQGRTGGGGYSSSTSRFSTQGQRGYAQPAPVAAPAQAAPSKKKLSFAEQNEEKLKARIRKKQLQMQLRGLSQDQYNQGYTGAIKRGALQKQMREGSSSPAFRR